MRLFTHMHYRKMRNKIRKRLNELLWRLGIWLMALIYNIDLTTSKLHLPNSYLDRYKKSLLLGSKKTTQNPTTNYRFKKLNEN